MGGGGGGGGGGGNFLGHHTKEDATAAAQDKLTHKQAALDERRRWQETFEAEFKVANDQARASELGQALLSNAGSPLKGHRYYYPSPHQRHCHLQEDSPLTSSRSAPPSAGGGYIDVEGGGEIRGGGEKENALLHC
jgi:hypothetical protein